MTLGDCSPTFAERFWSKVDTSTGPGTCWPWKGARSKKNRGRRGIIRSGGRGTRIIIAARAALALGTDGDLEPIEPETGERLEACHSCGGGGDKGDCCNPAHLYWGTRQQNVDDIKTHRERRAAEVVEAFFGASA